MFRVAVGHVTRPIGFWGHWEDAPRSVYHAVQCLGQRGVGCGLHHRLLIPYGMELDDNLYMLVVVVAVVVVVVVSLLWYGSSPAAGSGNSLSLWSR